MSGAIFFYGQDNDLCPQIKNQRLNPNDFQEKGLYWKPRQPFIYPGTEFLKPGGVFYVQFAETEEITIPAETTAAFN